MMATYAMPYETPTKCELQDGNKCRACVNTVALTGKGNPSAVLCDSPGERQGCEMWYVRDVLGDKAQFLAMVSAKVGM